MLTKDLFKKICAEIGFFFLLLKNRCLLALYSIELHCPFPVITVGNPTAGPALCILGSKIKTNLRFFTY